MTSALETSRNDTQTKIDLAADRIKNYVETLDNLATEAAQLREQQTMYKEQLASMKASQICSIKEWRTTQYVVHRTIRQLSHNLTKQETVEASLETENRSLKALKDQATVVQKELDKYGKLYQFPSL